MEFRIATRRVTAFAYAYAVLVLLATVYVERFGQVPASLQARAAVIGGLVISLAGLAVALGLLITVAFWVYASVRLTREHGMPSYGHLGYWGIAAFAVLFALGFVVGIPTVAGAARLLGCSILIFGVRHTRNWMARRADPGRPYSLVDGGDPVAPLAAQPTADDWNAAQWDPAVQDDIERRRRRE